MRKPRFTDQEIVGTVKRIEARVPDPSILRESV
jgi:hypothetical protein